MNTNTDGLGSLKDATVTESFSIRTISRKRPRKNAFMPIVDFTKYLVVYFLTDSSVSVFYFHACITVVPPPRRLT